MRAFYDPAQAAHDPQFFLVRGRLQPSSEQPERAERLLAGLRRCDISVSAPQDFGLAPLAAVHTPEYLRFLQDAYDAWQRLPEPSAEVVANVHPIRHAAHYPDSVVGRAGWHMADTACPIGAHTFAAARASAHCALSGAQTLLDGERRVYALCRPPGHHAFADLAGGFCFINNAAVAAEYLCRARRRVAIVDVDVHHGNGTQGIFYRRRDVLTVSLHADPRQFYPFHWGHAAERGAGDGEGYNRNLPLPLLSDDAAFLRALDEALASVAAFEPDALIVALGLDASEHDPLRGLSVTTDGFRRLGRALGRLPYPTLLVQEGGYLSDSLSDNLAAVLSGVAA